MSRPTIRRRNSQPLDPINVPAGTYLRFYCKMLLGELVVFGFLYLFWRDKMLTTFGALWGDGLSLAGLGHVWFIFIWALGVTALSVMHPNGRTVNSQSRPAQVAKGLWISLNAGFFEEILYRGFVFLSFMVLVRFMNFITFGLFKWFNLHVLVPVADWFTFHALHDQLVDHPSWVFGAAIIAATASFRDEHRYLGTLGWVNSWFIGMTMFWLVFHYGLPTAIAAHFAYDAIIFTIRGLTSEQPSFRLRMAREMLRGSNRV